jgi:hypothetical protein
VATAAFFFQCRGCQAEAGNGNSPNWLNNYEIAALDDIGFNDKEPKRSRERLYDLIAPVNKEA